METAKEVLIIGYQGFIGSNLWNIMKENISDRTYRATGTDKKTCEPIEDIEQIRVDPNWKPDIVVLLAANLEHDLNMYKHNLSIYNWVANTFPDAHFIYTSSAAVYGKYNFWASETTPTNPYNLYGKSKLLGEDIIKATKDNYTILRLSNVYGSGEGNGAIDKFINGENTIYGRGDQVRDYVPVQTVCNAIMKIIENPEKYNKETYNISTGIGKSVKEIFEEYGSGDPQYKTSREYDIEYSVLNRYKATLAGLL